MSTPITPVPNPPPATYPIPAPGEGVTSANTAQFVQPLADSVAWVASKVPGLNPSSALINLVLPPQLAVCSTNGGTTALTTDWLLACGITTRAIWFQQHLTGGDAVRYALSQSLTQGMVIHGFAADIEAAGGHGALPGIMPLVSLVKSARAIGGAIAAHTVIDSQVDSSPTVVAYQKMHTIAKALATPETVDLSLWCYELIIVGEGAANSLVGANLADVRLSVSA
jgi:hypothetical protein